MIKKCEYEWAQNKAVEMMKNLGIRVKTDEEKMVSIADFGLSDFKKEGAQILTFFNTERISAKVIVLFKNQTLPEHWHPPVGDDPGKEEVIRIIDGTVYFYIPGQDTVKEGFIPERKEEYYTARNENIMKAGDQIIIEPGVKHWFQAGKEGAVMYSISTCVRDGLDGFTDPNVVRETQIIDE